MSFLLNSKVCCVCTLQAHSVKRAMCSNVIIIIIYWFTHVYAYESGLDRSHGSVIMLRVYARVKEIELFNEWTSTLLYIMYIYVGLKWYERIIIIW